ncbi:MAG: flagellar assembly peptidoglycan hydrolase FlgJ [Gammaproteobacteria bacterium]|nr:flagellar assembly peptidoglycan hydrolase FlgJ [Gammaproteobacteria bacterium]
MTNGVSMYSDFAGLSQLREDAKDLSPDATREAARQFEALFIQMMLQSMRDANAVFAEDRDRTYEEMFDRQIAVELTRDKGIGIADMMMKQLALGGQSESAATGLATQELATFPGRTSSSRAVAAATARADWQPGGRDEFVRDLLPFAEQAAERLGVDAKVLIAQAALETGWGQRIIRDGRGISSNNLFGIKATGGWQGDRLNIPTLEYEQGIARRRQENFRAYPDLAEGFRDYVNLISGSERYGAAVDQAGDPDAYLDALQAAGYATDPDYASKIKAILYGPDLGEFVAEVKNSL